ncbi:MAG: PilZ domain-containing protein [Phycisphaerae bacterium]|nr:PilZ domain-containing protein [Phycisphaerae bacterium]
MIIKTMKTDKAVTHENEQRSSRRTQVNWPISVWHPKLSKFFNGKGLNVSRSGALVTLPMMVPLRKGQEVEVNFPRSQAMAKSKGQFARIKTARIVRIDRSDSVRSTQVKVGLEFNTAFVNDHGDKV